MTEFFLPADLELKKPETTCFQSIIDISGKKKETIIFSDDDINNINGASNFGLSSEL